jgi:Zn-finger nucleic acid-binding protein
MPPELRKPPPAGSLHCPNCGAIADEQATQCPYCRAKLATVSCPSCFRRLFVGAAYCSHCGAAAARQAGAEAVKVPCPQCKKDMAAVQLGSLTLSECVKCSGIWVGAEAFDKLSADKEAQAAVLTGAATAKGLTAGPPAQETRIRYRPCPSCKKMMNRVNFAHGSGVILDVCRAHGTFFDRDELHRVVTFIKDGGLERARIREREAFKEEERRVRALQSALPVIHGGYDDRSSTSGGGLFDLFVRSLIKF